MLTTTESQEGCASLWPVGLRLRFSPDQVRQLEHGVPRTRYQQPRSAEFTAGVLARKVRKLLNK